MQIHGPVHVHGPQSINGPHHPKPAQAPASPSRSHGVDQVEISRAADLVSRVREVPDIRSQRVAQIKEAIQSGHYETSEKLELALDRLLDEFGA